MTTAPAVRLVNLGRHFSAGDTVVRAVDNVSLEIFSGSLTLLTGPSGSGKTTLLSLIGGLLAPTQGIVEVEGMALSQLGQQELTAFRLQHLGIVFQAFHLIDALTVVENVELPLTLAGRRQPEAHDRALELVALLGLAHRSHFQPQGLSGGEKQRCAIARALANDPAIVLADEPTGSLDADAGDHVIALLHAEAATAGRAVIVASHDPRIGQVADVVVRMDFGRTVQVSGAI